MTPDADKPKGALAAAKEAAEAAKNAAEAAIAAAKLAQAASKGSPADAAGLTNTITGAARASTATNTGADTPLPDVTADAPESKPKKMRPTEKMARKLLGTLPPFTLDAVGGSACVAPLALAGARAVLAIMLGVLAGGSAMRGIWGATAPLALYAVLYSLLAAASVLRRMRVARWALWQHATALGALYQTLASLAICSAPLAAVLFGRNFEVTSARRRHSLIFLAYILPACAFLIDCALGAVPHFRSFVLPVPVIIGCAFVGIKFRQLRGRAGVLYGALFAWVALAALIALVSSRMTCWAKKAEAEPDGVLAGGSGNDALDADQKDKEIVSQV